MAAAEREAPRQAAMVRALLDGLPEAAGLPAVAIGGSFGGAVVVAAARTDARIRAVVNLDGWVYGDPETPPFAAAYLLMGADGPDLTVTEPQTATERRQALMDRREKPGMLRQFEAEGGALVILRGAEHADFFDAVRPAWPRAAGRITAARAATVVRAAVRGFLDAALAGGAMPLPPEQLRDYPELRVLDSRSKQKPLSAGTEWRGSNGISSESSATSHASRSR
jgi:pimeloyl-ACP methyl ester carboxylesterase